MDKMTNLQLARAMHTTEKANRLQNYLLLRLHVLDGWYCSQMRMLGQPGSSLQDHPRCCFLSVYDDAAISFNPQSSVSFCLHNLCRPCDSGEFVAQGIVGDLNSRYAQSRLYMKVAKLDNLC